MQSKPAFVLGSVPSSTMVTGKEAAARYARHLAKDWFEAWLREHDGNPRGAKAELGRILGITDVHAGNQLEEGRGAGPDVWEGWARHLKTDLAGFIARAEAWSRGIGEPIDSYVEHDKRYPGWAAGKQLFCEDNPRENPELLEAAIKEGEALLESDGDKGTRWWAETLQGRLRTLKLAGRDPVGTARAVAATKRQGADDMDRTQREADEMGTNFDDLTKPKKPKK